MIKKFFCTSVIGLEISIQTWQEFRIVRLQHWCWKMLAPILQRTQPNIGQWQVTQTDSESCLQNKNKQDINLQHWLILQWKTCIHTLRKVLTNTHTMASHRCSDASEFMHQCEIFFQGGRLDSVFYPKRGD